MLIGLFLSSSSGGGYVEQLADAKVKLAQASAKEQSWVKLGMAEKELKALEKRWKKVKKEDGEGCQNLEAKSSEVDALKKKV